MSVDVLQLFNTMLCMMGLDAAVPDLNVDFAISFSRNCLGC